VVWCSGVRSGVCVFLVWWREQLCLCVFGVVESAVVFVCVW
jgi:hypothetical protein